MGQDEGYLIKQVQIDATRNGGRLFRNSVGMAWQGRVGEEYTLKDRNGAPIHVVELNGAHRVAYGLTKGSSDLIGWQTVKITADMVGQTIAQFSAIECKTKRYSKATDEQDNFLLQVARAGGYAAIAREAEYGVKIERVGGER